jgi:hypothetical protein
MTQHYTVLQRFCLTAIRRASSSSAPLPAALLPHCRGCRCTRVPARWHHGRHNRQTSCRRARAWSSRSGVVRPPLHRRDSKRRSLVRADPAGRGKSTWVRERVRAAPTVGCLHADVFIERSALDRIPAVINQRRPHYYCPIASFSPWRQYPPSRALIQGCAGGPVREVLFAAVGQVYCRDSNPCYRCERAMRQLNALRPLTSASA